MPEYDLHILCRDCGGFHDTLVRVTLNHTFDVRRVSDIYPETIPLEFYQAIAQIHCSVTKKPVKPGNPDTMVFVAANLAQKVTRLPKKSPQNPTY
jgi:hypothetical protein